MAGYFGQLDKKKIVNVLDNGLASLKDDVREGTQEDVETLWIKFSRMEDVLYNEGKELLSMTNKVRFEKRLNTIRKMLRKK